MSLDPRDLSTRWAKSLLAGPGLVDVGPDFWANEPAIGTRETLDPMVQVTSGWSRVGRRLHVCASEVRFSFRSRVHGGTVEVDP